MKLRDLVYMLDSDEMIITDGEKAECVRLYLGETLDPYLDREVGKIRPYDSGFEIILVVA